MIHNDTGTETSKIEYFVDPNTGDTMAKVYGKSETGEWVLTGTIHVDQLVWNFAYDNHMIG